MPDKKTALGTLASTIRAISFDLRQVATHAVDRFASYGRRPNQKLDYSQLEPTNIPAPSWTLADVDAALDAHEIGQFQESAALVDAMGRDDRITACLNTRVKALASRGGLTFSIEPSDVNPHRSNPIAARVEQLWWDICPESTQQRILRDAVMLGVAIGRNVWHLVDGEYVPKIEPWDLQYVYWQDSEKAYYASTDQGTVAIRHGDPNWFIWEPLGYRSWMSGAVRCLGRLFVFGMLDWRNWARYNEKHGCPILTIKEPASWDFSDKLSFFEKMKTLGREAVIRLPTRSDGTGFQVGYAQPSNTQSYESFLEFGKRRDISVAIILLGQNLSTEVSGGSLAAARSQDRVRIDYLSGDAEGFSTAARDSTLKPFVVYNYDSGLPEYAPYPRWETRIPEDDKTKAETFKSVFEGAKKAQESPLGELVDYEKLGDRFGVPLKEEEEDA